MGVSVYWFLSVLCLCVRSNQSITIKPHYVPDLCKLTPPPPPPHFCWGKRRMGEASTKREGLDKISAFKGGLLGKRRVTF